eukprot:scaffold1643_cov390-Prasinococcus_capsulatus_cf.AAC.6
MWGLNAAFANDVARCKPQRLCMCEGSITECGRQARRVGPEVGGKGRRSLRGRCRGGGRARASDARQAGLGARTRVVWRCQTGNPRRLDAAYATADAGWGASCCRAAPRARLQDMDGRTAYARGCDRRCREPRARAATGRASAGCRAWDGRTDG